MLRVNCYFLWGIIPFSSPDFNRGTTAPDRDTKDTSCKFIVACPHCSSYRLSDHWHNDLPDEGLHPWHRRSLGYLKECQIKFPNPHTHINSFTVGFPLTSSDQESPSSLSLDTNVRNRVVSSVSWYEKIAFHVL